MSTSALIAALKPFAELPTLPGFSRSAYLLDHTLIHTPPPCQPGRATGRISLTKLEQLK
jgi:hypothetical protein